MVPQSLRDYQTACLVDGCQHARTIPLGDRLTSRSRICNSSRLSRFDGPAAVEGEHLGQAIEVAVQVQHTHTGFLSRRCDKDVREWDAVRQIACSGELSHGSDRFALHRYGDGYVWQSTLLSVASGIEQLDPDDRTGSDLSGPQGRGPPLPQLRITRTDPDRLVRDVDPAAEGGSSHLVAFAKPRRLARANTSRSKPGSSAIDRAMTRSTAAWRSRRPACSASAPRSEGRGPTARSLFRARRGARLPGGPCSTRDRSSRRCAGA